MTTKTNNSVIKLLKYFDFKMGVLGGIVLGTIVFIINFDHGVTFAVIAALKQATYTFLAGGFMLRLTENIATSVDNYYMAIVAAVIVSTTVAVALTYLVHSLRGTPEPFNSTIPTMILAPWSFLWWALRKRRQLKTVRD